MRGRRERSGWGGGVASLKGVVESGSRLLARLSALSWIVVAVIFIVFPIALVWLGLDHLIDLKVGNERSDLVRRLDQGLDRIESCKKGEWFAHAMLKRIWAKAERSPDPVAYLRRAIPRLKKEFPGYFRFVVWDREGKPVDDLTDFSGYRYVLKKAWSGLKEVSRNFMAPVPQPIDSLPDFSEGKKVFSSFLGRLFFPGLLSLPFQRNPPPSVILSDFDPTRTYFWFHVGRKVGILSFLHRKTTRSTDFLEWLMRKRNKRRRHGDAALGLAWVENPGAPVFPGVRIDPKSVTPALLEFETSAEPFVETPRFMIHIRRISPRLRGIAVLPKSRLLASPAAVKKNRFIQILIPAIAIPIVLLWIWFGTGGFFSIRWKLALLFFYANGLPLLVLLFLGVDYLQQKRAAIENNLRIEGEQVLGRIDARFMGTLRRMEEDLAARLEAFDGRMAGRVCDKEDIKHLLTDVSSLEPASVFLIDEGGGLAGGWCRGGVEQLKTSSPVMRTLGKAMLGFWNGGIDEEQVIEEDEETPGSLSMPKPSRNLLQLGIVIRGSIRRNYMGQTARWTYYQGVRGGTRPYQLFLILQWDEETINRLYLGETLEQLSRNRSDVRILAQTENSDRVFPLQGRVSEDVKTLLRKTRSLRSAFSREIRLQDRDFVGVGIAGKTLIGTALVSLFPISEIEKVMSGMRIRLVAFSLLSLLLTFGIGQMLAFQFLDPVRSLGEAAVAIQEHRFQHRIPELDQDELGRLGQVFNQVMEGLEELQVARIVQESLFPEQALKGRNLRVYGKSIAMMELGGDYFDFFPVGDGKIGVVMGDVAGHGVPAALVMAMAKATVLIGGEARENPKNLTTSLNSLIHSLQRKSMKRMMTFQYALFDGDTGLCTIANAGHCFPILVRPTAEKASFIEIPGMPLGAMKTARIKCEELKLQPGDSILFYTDGIVEARDRKDEPLGYNRLQELARSTYDPEPRVFYERLFKAYCDWDASPGDDVTLIVVGFGDTGRG